jgi:hypothetical protein
MSSSVEARTFTDTILSAVRLQRHLGLRIIISTQEPTISPSLLNLCSVTIVHRFTSPEWLRILHKHLAAAASDPFTVKGEATSEKFPEAEELDVKADSASLFNRIVRLRVGEALLFSPSAIVGMTLRDDGDVGFRRLGAEYLAVRVRARLTLDGGKSVLSY